MRCGENIAYYQNGIRRRDKGGTNYYTLTFTMQFPNDHDTVFLSHCYPYTYTDLQKDLQALEQDPSQAEGRPQEEEAAVVGASQETRDKDVESEDAVMSDLEGADNADEGALAAIARRLKHARRAAPS